MKICIMLILSDIGGYLFWSFTLFFLHWICWWKLELVILFLSSIPCRVEPHIIWCFPSAFLLFAKTNQLSVYHGHSIWVSTNGYCIKFIFTLLQFLYFSMIWPSILPFVLFLPSTRSSVIFPLLFFAFIIFWFFWVWQYLKLCLPPQFQHEFCVALNEPFIWSAKRTVGGDYLLESWFYMNHCSGTNVIDTCRHIELGDALLIQQ